MICSSIDRISSATNSNWAGIGIATTSSLTLLLSLLVGNGVVDGGTWRKRDQTFGRFTINDDRGGCTVVLLNLVSLLPVVDGFPLFADVAFTIAGSMLPPLSLFPLLFSFLVPCCC